MKQKNSASKKIASVLGTLSFIAVIIAIYIAIVSISSKPKATETKDGWQKGELVIYGGKSLTFNVPTSATVLRMKDVTRWRIDFLPPCDSAGYCVLWSLGQTLPDTIWARKSGPPVRFNWDERTFWIWSGPSQQKMLISTE